MDIVKNTTAVTTQLKYYTGRNPRPLSAHIQTTKAYNNKTTDLKHQLMK